MQIAGIELRVNHPVMVLGSTEFVPVSLAIHDSPAVGSDSHVVVRVQARSTLVKVRLFSEMNDVRELSPLFTTVFEGPLALPNGRFVIGDGLGDSRFVKYLGKPGMWRVRVAADDAVGYASAVDIGVQHEPSSEEPAGEQGW